MHAQVVRFAAGVGPHGRRMGGHFGRPGALILLLLLVGAVITLAVLLARSRHRVAPGGISTPLPPGPWASNPGSAPTPTPPPASPTASPTATAEAILAERFARGEISVDEFVAARSALRGESAINTPPAPSPSA